MSYYLTDHLGSTRAVVNNSGTVLETFDYYPFGLLMPKRNTAGANTLEKFTGHELDDEGGLNLFYAGARYLDPALGRWHSVDPLGDDLPSWSSYAYAFNNPVFYIDPDGRCPEDGSAGDAGDGDGYCMEEVVVTATRIDETQQGKRPFSNTLASLPALGSTTQIDGPISPVADFLAGAVLLGYIAYDAYLIFNPTSTEPIFTQSRSIDWANNPPVSPRDLSSDWVEVPSQAPNRREFENEKTGDEIAFDEGQAGRPGWAGRDHWHRKNPNSTGKHDEYLDKDGNPVRRGSKKSHIPAGGK